MRFKSITDAPEREFRTLASLITDAERFADAEPFRVVCRKCKTETVFETLNENAVCLF